MIAAIAIVVVFNVLVIFSALRISSDYEREQGRRENPPFDK